MKDFEKAALNSCINRAKDLCTELETMAELVKEDFSFHKLLSKAKHIRHELLDISRDSRD